MKKVNVISVLFVFLSKRQFFVGVKKNETKTKLITSSFFVFVINYSTREGVNF